MAYQLQEINRSIRADVAEFLAECDQSYAQRVSLAADRILGNLNKSPIVLLSGPSGSGKTTTAMKIAEELRRRGVNSHAVAMDNYFKDVDPNTAPRTPEGELDVDALRPIYAAARAAAKAAGRPVVCTLHRAFDVCKDPFAVLEAAKALNLGTILTSGQAASAPAGASLLRRLVEAAGPDLEILVGAGVTPANLPALAAETGAHAFHMSGKQVLDSRMIFRREGVPMGLPGFSEFEVWQTSEETIRAARRILNEL